MLKNKKIVLCVTGSVALIQAPRLVRELKRRGANVVCVMSEAAQKVLNPELLEWASQNKVVTKLTGKAEHVFLAGKTLTKADLILIAPCTANTLAKIASGISDSTVSLLCSTALGTKIPLTVIPSMHKSLYDNPVFKKNKKILSSNGVQFFNPKFEEKKAKFPDIKVVADLIEANFVQKDLKGKKILITGGPTFEQIDDMRILSNNASGKMAIALAENAFERGANVTLVLGNTNLKPRFNIKTIQALNSKDMLFMIKKHVKAKHLMIHSAAVSDFTVKKIKGKISSKKNASLKLIPNKKILNSVKKWNKKIFLISFKAEFGVSKKFLINKAFETLQKADSDFIVANDVKKNAFGSDKNEVFVVFPDKKFKHFKPAKKIKIASQIFNTFLDVQKQ